MLYNDEYMNTRKEKTQKGFTLIELLVVIAIIAILAVVVVLTLNPAQLLAQARDSNRISDFATIKSALALYGTDVQTTTPMYGTTGYTGGGAYDLYSADASAPTSTSNYNTTSSITSWGFLGGETGVITTSSRAVNGTGWIPVNLTAISAGAPIGVYPVDPVNTGITNMYVYAATTTSWKVTCNMESAKYSHGGSNDVESYDGGNTLYAYEQGSNLAL
jgi:prepilin-type N-terminal cleavage/methylation domain-containing protein